MIVSFHPTGDGLGRILSRLAPQVDAVVVADNSPKHDDSAFAIIRQYAPASTRISLLRFGENLGIAAALNEGVTAAIREGADFVITSDQDSLPAEGMLQALHECHTGLVEAGYRVGAVGPTYADEYTGYTYPFQVNRPDKLFYGHATPDSSTPVVETLAIITSGSFFAANTFKRVGTFREDFFIDHVDTEWCHRLRAHGYSIFGCAAATMQQRLGEEQLRVWFFGWRKESAYGPQRIYYRVRNYVALLPLQHMEWHWKLRSGWYMLGIVYANLVFNRKATRREFAWAALRGLWHGMTGRLGRDH